MFSNHNHTPVHGIATRGGGWRGALIALMAVFAVFAGPGAGVAAALKPVNNLLPEIVGRELVGETLGCGTGSWSNSPTTFKYEWLRVGIPIHEGVSYKLTAADEHHEVWCVVTAINSSGESPPTESSNSVIVGGPEKEKKEVTGPPENLTKPVASGEAKVGATLSCSQGTWTGQQPISYAYKWFRQKTEAISNATSATYKLTGEDEGRSLSCKVSATNGGGTTTVESNSVNLPGEAPKAKIAPTIVGIPEVGQRLTCLNSEADWTGSRPLTFKYTWLRNGVPTSVIASVYTVEPADEGASVKCRVIASNSEGPSKELNEPNTSESVTIRLNPPTNTRPPEIKGNPAPGATLTCEKGVWTGSPTKYAFKWLRGAGQEQAPGAATAETYKVPEGESGYTLYCNVTASNSGGATPRLSLPVVIPEAGGPPPVALEEPVVLGGSELGAALTCQSAWEGTPELIYQWVRRTGASEVSLEGSYLEKYTVVAQDEGSTLTCSVTAVNSHGKTKLVSPGHFIPGTAPKLGNPKPELIGNPRVGESLTCLHGEWSGAPRPTFAYEWKRDGVAIAGEKGSAHTVVAADRGTALSCAVTATNEEGKATALTNELYVLGSAPEGEAPTIIGKPELGEALTCVPNTWTGAPAPTLSYQWLLNGVPVPGETTNTFTVALADRGLTITCRVTGKSREGEAAATSKGLHVPGIRPQDVTPPEISGSAALGATVTCNRGIWKGSPPPSFSYQWLRDGAAIGGATASTYIVEPADQGHLISCIVTGANSEATVEAESSNGLAIPMRIAQNGVSPFIASGPITKRLSAATILASLKLQLTKAGRGLHLSSVLKHGGFTFPFTAPAAGTLELRWNETVKAAHSSGTKTTQLLVGRTSAVYTAAVKRTMHLKLTSKGRSALKGKKQVKIIVKGVFTVPHSGPVTWTGSLLLSH